MGYIVDVHCHTFNADDLPVQGFVHRVFLKDALAARDLSVLVDLLLQGKAPDYAREVRRLDRMLSGEATSFVDDTPPDVDDVTREVLAQLQRDEPELVASLDATMPAEAGAGSAAFGGLVSGAYRAVKWAVLFGSYRVDITTHLVRNFADEVDLFTPMLVDLGIGVKDREISTVAQQVELQEKISRLSMLGRLPGAARAHVHPFIGFDPRRQAHWSGSGPSPLEVVQDAVLSAGFVGVKLYPPMGFRPLGNTPTALSDGRIEVMSAAAAGAVDDALHQLYAWCEKQDVPVTAHCNASNGAHADYTLYSHPDSWATVLEHYPGLHLNLGHFGGSARTRGDGSRNDWPERIAAATQRWPHLYADVGNHRIDKQDVARDYLQRLVEVFSTWPTMQERLMYGSDWLMLAILPGHGQFLRAYEKLYRDAFPDPAQVGRFLGGAALSFLGFDDPTNRNNARLRERYATWAPGAPLPGWLALPQDALAGASRQLGGQPHGRR